MSKARRWSLLLLCVVVPLGFLCKVYDGWGSWWFNDYGGGVMYEIFFCLVFFLFFPARKNIVKIAAGVLIVTCLLEVMQLWQPGFLQAIRAALSIKLKEQMGVDNILKHEEKMVERLFGGLRAIPDIHILADNIEARLGIFSFYVHTIHYILMVRLLNDRFGIHVRGGCSCAGTYGHYLLHIDPGRSRRITDLIDRGDYSQKPGWIRISLHPTLTDAEVDYIGRAIQDLAEHHLAWREDYDFDPACLELTHKRSNPDQEIRRSMEAALNRNFI